MGRLEVAGADELAVALRIEIIELGDQVGVVGVDRDVKVERGRAGDLGVR